MHTFKNVDNIYLEILPPLCIKSPGMLTKRYISHLAGVTSVTAEWKV